MNAMTQTPSLSGFRRFSIEQLRSAADLPSIHSATQLIHACAVRHWGEDHASDMAPPSRGALGLAQFLIDNAAGLERPLPGSSLLLRGDMLERLMIGMMLPTDDVAQAIAHMTGGAVLPEQFDEGFPYDGTSTLAMAQDEAPAVDPANGDPATGVAVAADVPAFGVLGGQLPSGRLFHIIGDTRLPNGFLLSGCGLLVGLDESTALAMRSAIDAGIAHLRDVRGEAQAA